MSNCYRLFVPSDKITSGGQALYIRRQLPSGVLEYKLWSSMLWEADDVEPSPNVYVYFCSIYEYFTTDYKYGTSGTPQAIPEITYEIISTGCSTDADVANNYFYTNSLGQSCSNPIGFTRYYAANKFGQPAYTADYIWALYTNSGFTGSKLNNGSATTIGFGKTQYALNPTWSANVDATGTFTNVAYCPGQEPTTTTTTTACPSTYYGMSLKYHLTDIYSVCSGTTYVNVSGNTALFATTTRLYSDSSCTLAPTGYYGSGTSYRYWNADTKQMSSAGACSLLPPQPTTTTSTTKVPSTQPAGFVFSRSPIVYRFQGLNQNNRYYLDVYISRTKSDYTLYVSIERIPDLATNPGIVIDVSNVINMWLKNNFTFDSDNICYFYTQLLEYNGPDLISTQTSNVQAASIGYNDTIDGTFNHSINEFDIMTTMEQNSAFSIPTSVNYTLPVKYEDNITWYVIFYTYLGNQVVEDFTYTGSKLDATDEVFRIPVGYPNWLNISTKHNITVIVSGKTYIFSPESCAKNDLVELKFVNKYGLWDYFYCTGKKEDGFNIDYEEYKYVNVDYSTMVYDKRSGMYHKSWISGRDKIILNTNWLDENKNLKFKELLLSEYVLIGDVPYTITNKEAKYKTNKNDKVINYVITLEKQYDTINNIR